MIKRARSLRQRKARQETGLFLVEGLHHVGEALEAGWQFDAILYAPEVLTSEFGSRLVGEESASLQPVSSDVMRSLADKENPQGILGIVHQRQAALNDLASVERLVAMVSPQDAGNVGTVLRTMDAAGVDALLLVDGGVDPFHPTCVRASMGALFWKPIVQVSFAEAAGWAHSRGIQMIATSAHASSDYVGFKPTPPWMLILGSEQKGLSREQQETCDVRLSLPMRGRASSLNVAVAAGILLYDLTA